MAENENPAAGEPACPSCGARPAMINCTQGAVAVPDGRTLIVAQMWCGNPDCGALFMVQILHVIPPQGGPERDINLNKARAPGGNPIWRPS